MDILWVYSEVALGPGSRGETGPGLERVDEARNSVVGILLRIGGCVPWGVRVVVRDCDEPVDGDE